MPGKQARGWCFTINNPTSEEGAYYTRMHEDTSFREEKKVSYLITGEEKGESGTPHIQGYVEFATKRGLGFVKGVIGTRAHVEARKGTPRQAADYCRKDGIFVESGIISNPGRRTDLEEIRESIKSGATQREIAESHWTQWVVYRKSFEAYKRLLTPPRLRPDLRVYCLIGLPGTGKTRFARSFDETSFWISSDPTLRWFDGYEGERVAIIDDYRGGADAAHLLRILDIYELSVPIKGGFVSWIPDVIFLTSNLEVPFGHDDIHVALARRIKKTIKFHDNLDFNDESKIAEMKSHLQ